MILQQPLLALLAMLYPIVSFLPVAIFLLFFIRQHAKTGQKMFLHLAALFAVTLANQGCMIISSVANVQAIAEIFFIIAQIIDIDAMLVVLMVLEAFEESKPFTPRVGLFAALAALIIGTIIADPTLTTESITTFIGNTYIVQFQRQTITTFFLLMYSLLVFIWLAFTFFKKRKLTKNMKQKHLITWLFIGIFLSQMVGSFTPAAIETSIHAYLREITMNIGLTRVIGTIIIGLAFYKVNKTPWLLQLQRVHVLLVYAKNGVPLYSKTFREDISDTDIQLLAGAITAVTALFKESTKTTTPVESILFKGKTVRIIDRGSFTCALIVDYASQASDSAHVQFTREFETRFAAEIASFSGNVSKFTNTEEIAVKYFG
nr:hypothetical protein [Candidatus Sigynarchaeota archaeon]